MERARIFLKKNFLWLIIIFVPWCILCYEVYKVTNLSNEIDQEMRKIRSLRIKTVTMNREIVEKKENLKRILLKNEEITRKVKTLIKYEDISSLNSRITALLIKYKIKILSLETSEETVKDSFRLISVKLSLKGKEDRVIKLLDELVNNLPIELQSLKLALPDRNLLVNLAFKVPLMNVGKPQ